MSIIRNQVAIDAPLHRIPLVPAVAFVLIGLLPSGAVAAPLTEEGCSVAYLDAKSKEANFEDAPGLSILNWDPAQPLRLARAGSQPSAVLCWRSAAKFSANDYIVALAGLPLYIKTDDVDPTRNRTLVLEGTSGGFRVRLLSGPALSKAEQQELRQLIEGYNANRARASVPSSPKIAPTPTR